MMLARWVFTVLGLTLGVLASSLVLRLTLPNLSPGPGLLLAGLAAAGVGGGALALLPAWWESGPCVSIDGDIGRIWRRGRGGPAVEGDAHVGDLSGVADCRGEHEVAGDELQSGTAQQACATRITHQGLHPPTEFDEATRQRAADEARGPCQGDSALVVTVVSGSQGWSVCDTERGFA